MVREMVGGCCVCLDERGWNENPLVYCDGSGCSVAVHQACYGIVKVPSGPWFCCKCRSQERVARVKCELCPNKGGALKRTESGGWAHVVCALYIPEVRFGDVSTMEPIIFSSVPNDRFVKTCFICEEDGRESIRSVNGACMNCHKTQCKLSFHVTCAQSRRLLCEEASVNGHVQYVGYCTSHWSKRFKQQPPPPPSPLQPLSPEDKKGNRDKGKGRSRNDSTSSTNSLDVPKTRGRKKNTDTSPDAKSDSRNSNITPPKAEENNSNSIKNTETTNIGKSKAVLPVTDNHSVSASSKLCSNEKLKGTSPLNTPVPKNETKPDDGSSNSKANSESKSKNESKKRKFNNDDDKAQKRQKIKTEKVEAKDKKKKVKSSVETKKEKKFSTKDKSSSEKKQKFPVPSKLGLVENGKVSSWESVTPKHAEPPDNFQDFLEHQWNQSAHFITSKAEHFDVASLLACLHQLKSDNLKLEKKLMNIQARRDRLLGVNARLAASFTEVDEEICNGRSPLSAMLSKLNDKSPTSPLSQDKDKKNKVSPQTKSVKKKRPVASPDLAMLAAASVKLESESMTRIEENEETNSDSEIPSDERPPLLNNDNVNSMLVQPNITSRADSLIDSSLDRLLAGQRHAYNHVGLFADCDTADNPASSSSSSP